MEEPQKLSGEALQAVRDGLSGGYSGEEIEEALEEIQQLIDMEELFTKDVYLSLIHI